MQATEDKTVCVMAVAAGNERNQHDRGVPVGVSVELARIGRPLADPKKPKLHFQPGEEIELTAGELSRLKKLHPSVKFVKSSPKITAHAGARKKIEATGGSPDKQIAQMRKAGMDAEADRLEKLLSDAKKAKNEAAGPSSQEA